MPKKKDKFYICISWTTNIYNTLKSHKNDTHTIFIILILKLQENSPRCHADLFISRLTWNIFFCLIIRLAGFSSVFYFVFCSPCAFLCFPLRKAASCSKYTYFHSRKLESLSNLGSDNSPSLFWAYQLISLLNLTNPATTILYHSSLAISFSSVR